jgi:type I restriction enzyme S subunit
METPAEWTVKSIKFVCLKTEQWIPSKDKRDSFQYIDVSSVSNSTFTIKDTSLVKADAAPGRARKIVKWQDTIFATIRPSLKRVAFIPREYDNQIASTAFCVVRPNQKQLTPLYVYYFLLSDLLNIEINGLQHGASYPAITDKEVLNQTIPLPPLPEQQKIAAVLFKIQKSIEIQEFIIEKTRELKKSTLHCLEKS